MDDKRRRGWGTVSWYSYGPFLNWLEEEQAGATYRSGRPSTTFLRLLRRVGTTPAGAESAPSPLTEDQIKKLAAFKFPVHAVGYNWLKSNADSGLDLANKIQEIRNEYERRGLQYNGGRPWLFIQDASGRVIKRLSERGDPYTDI